MNAEDVVKTLTDLFMIRGVPGYIRSDNGGEFIAAAIRRVAKITERVQPSSAALVTGIHAARDVRGAT